MTAISSIVAIAITIIIIIIAMYYSISIMNKYIELVDKSIEITLNMYEVCIPDVKLLNYSITNNVITFNITLVRCEIPINKFKYIDMIITYQDINNISRIEWVKYSQNCTIGTWCIVDIYQDYLNPINITTQTGIWDPGEIIKINLTTFESIYNVIELRIVFPSGYYTDVIFT